MDINFSWLEFHFTSVKNTAAKSQRSDHSSLESCPLFISRVSLPNHLEVDIVSRRSQVHSVFYIRHRDLKEEIGPATGLGPTRTSFLIQSETSYYKAVYERASRTFRNLHRNIGYVHICCIFSSPRVVRKFHMNLNVDLIVLNIFPFDYKRKTFKRRILGHNHAPGFSEQLLQRKAVFNGCIGL